MEQNKNGNMIRHNQTIYDFLTTYVNMPIPNYAILLKGKWGCGKTFFVDQWLKGYSQPMDGLGEEDIVLKPIKVSLYGMSNIGQITDAIDKELHPFLHSKFIKYAKKALNIFGKITISSKFDLIGDDGKEESSFSTSVDALSLLKSDDNRIKGVRFLIFDDLERCTIPIKELLGYLNYFVEMCKCHVVIIGDETRAEESVQKNLVEFKEKTIGREFTIEPELDAALEYFLHEIFEVAWLTDQKDLIIRTFNLTGCNNLRILRQCIYDFKVQYQEWNEELIAKDNSFLRNLLVSFIIVYCEYKGGNSELLKGWKLNYWHGLMMLNDDAKSAIGQMQSKYNGFSEKEGLEALNPDNIACIVYYIETGRSTAQYVNEAMAMLQQQPTALDRLNTFMDMSNKEATEVCETLAKEIEESRMPSLYLLARAVSFLSYLDYLGIYTFKKKTIYSVIKMIKDATKLAANMDELYEIRRQIIQGANSYVQEIELPVRIEIMGEFQSLFDERKQKMNNLMEGTLANLSDDNVGNLQNIDGSTMPDGQRAYELYPLFERSDMKQLCQRIIKLSNRGKREFRSFLQNHYKLWYQIDGVREFMSDKDKLTELLALIQIESAKAQKVDKYAYNHLIECIEKCIKRAEGEKCVLM